MFPTFVPLAINVYSVIHTTTTLAIKQGKKTTNALIDSFNEPVLYFFEGSSIPQISNRIFEESKAYWVYNTVTKTFYTSKGNSEFSHLPYISATLLDNTQEIGNLSEWMEDVKSNSKVPLKHLIVAWAYCNSIKLKYSLDYKLSVFTIDGEEEMLDVSGL